MGSEPLSGMRVSYTNPPLEPSAMADTPLRQFNYWFEEALASGTAEPNAMVLSTADADGRVSSRTVLLKGIAPEGLTFFTNLHSAKAKAIAEQPNVAVVFPWYVQQRQVCVTGTARMLSRSEVDAYFATRPRDSQLGAWASEQSQVIPSSDDLIRAFDDVAARFPASIPTPPHWGGFLIVVEAMEFWSGQPSRLHDRLRYRRVSDGGLDDANAWILERLAP